MSHKFRRNSADDALQDAGRDQAAYRRFPRQDSFLHPTEHELRQFLEAPLGSATETLIDGHLAECESCRALIETMIDADFGSSPGASSSFETTVSWSSLDSSQSAIDTVSQALDQQRTEGIKSTDANEIKSAPDGFALRFVILGEIDRGGMGVVYRAFDRGLKREIAVKVSAAPASGKSGIRFQREAEISAQLAHPGIVPVHETGRLQDGRQFIAMKLIRGNTLSKLIADQDESLQQIATRLEIFNDICHAMAFAHSRDIIHRDLKPENIMIGMFGEVQIMDWGLAAKLNSRTDDEVGESQNTNSIRATRQGDVFGTPAYMPPEQARGDQADKRTDVFAIGGILYEMLCGKPPFDAPTISVALATSADSDLTTAFGRLDESDADEALIALVKTCLAANPNDRPADAQVVSQQFTDYLAGREQQFDDARLEKARATERLIAQQKRTKHLLWFSVASIIALTALGLAGYMYLTEKNARLANESRIERERMEQAVRDEGEIRKSIAAAQVYAATADTRAAHEQAAQRMLALKEIEKATPFLSQSVDSELLAEFRELELMTRAKSAIAVRRKEQHDVEAACVADLFPLREHSYFPEDMRICRWVNLLPELQSVYQRLGIQPGVISHEAVSRLQQSPYKTELIHGLIVWQREINMRLIYKDTDLNHEPELKAVNTWIDELIDRADPDSLRTRLRAAIGGETVDALALLQSDEAVESLLTVYTAVSFLVYDNVPLRERTEYLLRAHRLHSKDFFVNWYLPVMSGGSDNQEDYALACYSLRPENPAVLNALGAALLKSKRPAQAIEAYEQLTKVAPWYYLGHKHLAVAYRMVGKTEMAEKQYSRAAKALDEARPLFERRMKHYRESNRIRKARILENYLADSERGLNMEPVRSLNNTTIEQRKKLEAAIAKKKSDIRRAPGNQGHHGKMGELYVSLCELLTDAGKPSLVRETVDAAIADFKESAKLAPEVSTPHERLSVLCEKFDRLDVAIDSLKKARLIHPDYGPHKDRLVKLYGKLCDQHEQNQRADLLANAIDKAIEDLNQLSSESSAKSDHFHKAFGSFAKKYRRYDEAVVAYKRAAKTHPDYHPHLEEVAELSVLAGRQHKASGKPEQAYASLDAAIKIYRAWAAESAPDFSIPHERLSEACEHRERFAESMKHLKIAIGIHPKYGPHHARYAKLAIQLSEQQRQSESSEATETGIETLTDAIALLQGHNADQELLIDPHTALSKLYRESGDYDQAITAIKHAIDLRPGDQFLQEQIADLFVSSQQIEKAEEVFLAMKAAHPTSPHVVAALATFYLDQNELTQAGSVLREAFSAGVSSSELKQLMSRTLSKTKGE